MTWDAAKPAGSQKIRLSDEEIRANWDALEDALNREHTFPGTYGGTAGQHKPGVMAAIYKGTTTQINALTGMNTDAWAWDTTLACLKRYTGTAWEVVSTPLDKAGGTMTGAVVLSGDPSLALHPVTLQYLQALQATQTLMGIAEVATAAEIVTGTDDARMMTPAGAAGSKSLAANGYFIFPGGLKVNWAKITAAANTTTGVTFASAFTTACYGTQVTMVDAGTNDCYELKLEAEPSLSGAVIRNTNPYILTVYVLAWGK